MRFDHIAISIFQKSHLPRIIRHLDQIPLLCPHTNGKYFHPFRSCLGNCFIYAAFVIFPIRNYYQGLVRVFTRNVLPPYRSATPSWRQMRMWLTGSGHDRDLCHCSALASGRW